MALCLQWWCICFLEKSDQRETFLGAQCPYVERDLLKKIGSYKQGGSIILFSGVRRSGKSVILQSLCSEGAQSDYYCNFDDERLLDFKVEDFQTLLELLMEMFGV